MISVSPRGVARRSVPALLALSTAVACAAGLAALGGSNPGVAIAALVEGSLGSTANVADTLVRATPLLLCGAAVMVAFRSGVFNIGADGQFLVGALVAAAVAIWIPPFRGQAVAAVVAAAVAGALWAMLPAMFRIGREVSEVITTILLNFVALYLVSWAVTGPLQEPARTYPQSAPIAPTSELWRLFSGGGERVHAGVLLALLLVVAAGALMSRTAIGLRLRAAGLNATAARLAGFPVTRDLVVAFAASGALAGIAGAVELTGVTHRLYEKFSPGYGYTAIAVALLGGLHAPGVVVAALFFAALGAGASAMERSAGVSAVVAVAVQGATLLAVAISGTPAFARLLRSPEASTDPAGEPGRGASEGPSVDASLEASRSGRREDPDGD